MLIFAIQRCFLEVGIVIPQFLLNGLASLKSLPFNRALMRAQLKEYYEISPLLLFTLYLPGLLQMTSLISHLTEYREKSIDPILLNICVPQSVMRTVAALCHEH